MTKPQHYARFDASVSPVIACEHTATGWRGLTKDGEILNVHAHVNGSPSVIPKSLALTRGDDIVSYFSIENEANDGIVADYVRHLDASTALLRKNDPVQALAEIDVALACARTVLARYNRAMVLLHLGRWQEGFDEFAYCEDESPLFQRPQMAAAYAHGLCPWCGDHLPGKKLLLIHDHGFGDTIMMLRFVPALQAMGAEVMLQVPAELERLAAQVVPVTRELVDADYVCSILQLMAYSSRGWGRRLMLGEDAPAPYLKVDAGLRDKWRAQLGTSKRKRIGFAWSVGVDHIDDYPRSIPLGQMIKALSDDGELHSVQNGFGPKQFQFEDFADCAALMSLMDEIVTVDTAAVHLAGAIGHPRITLLLSHWASWRWQLPLYQNVRICQQDRAGDWDSAFAKVRQ
jgi:Glycosyltransferase family 9 (heptosyltransferase)